MTTERTMRWIALVPLALLVLALFSDLGLTRDNDAPIR